MAKFLNIYSQDYPMNGIFSSSEELNTNLHIYLLLIVSIILVCTFIRYLIKTSNIDYFFNPTPGLKEIHKPIFYPGGEN